MGDSEKLKVAFIHPDLGIGGAERLVLDIAVALKSGGFTVEFITNHFDRNHAFEELKTDEYTVTVIGNWLPRSIFGVFQAFCAYFRMLYLAVVYCFFSNKADLFVVDQIPMAVPILKLTGRPIIYYCHHPDLLASPPGGALKRAYRLIIDWLEEIGTNKADAILANSKYTTEIFHKTFPNIQHELEVLYPTISASFLRNIKEAEKKPICELIPELVNVKTDDVIFISINRFHPAKQLDLAIEALSELREKLNPEDYKRMHLIMAGGYDPLSQTNRTYYQKLIALAESRNVADKIAFLKSPSDKLKAELLKACDCLIYTPTNEHFGIVPLEAMAASKPVIACNSGGPRETVEHGVTGFLCEPSVASLAEYMCKFLDREIGVNFGHMGLKRMQESFSNEAFRKNCNTLAIVQITKRTTENVMKSFNERISSLK